VLALLVGLALAAPADAGAQQVRKWKIHYRAHNGVPREAYVILPASYTPKTATPIPLVISPHGRGVSALANTKVWGGLPAQGEFAVISPDGQGRKLGRYSWGSAGQIEDLARMPQIVRLAMPWVKIDPHRIYAFGGSMGGQEVLLLLARHPRLLAGAAVFDAVTDLAMQYRKWPSLRCSRSCRKKLKMPLGRQLQRLANEEVGAAPWVSPGAYGSRSPITYARGIARSCVPLQLWWSPRDQIVIDQKRQTGHFYDELIATNPQAPVYGFVGFWKHSAEMRAQTRLPLALATFGLLAAEFESHGSTVTVKVPPSGWCQRPGG